MFTEFYGLTASPFKLTPDPRFFFQGPIHRRATAHLLFGIDQREGFVVLTGEAGCGKTAVLGHVLDAVADGSFLAGRLVSSRLDCDDLLRAAAASFGLPYVGSDKATTLRRLEDFLTDCQGNGLRVLLVIDEAQGLTAGALEELRLLSNVEGAGRAALQIILAGQPALARQLALPEGEALRQRVVASCQIGPLAAGETKDYILHRLGVAGWHNDPVFADDVFAELFELSGGVPRRVNMLCNRLLLSAALDQVHRVDRTVLRGVIEDMPQDLGLAA